MRKLLAASVRTRKRGNPDWGRPHHLSPALATEFEVRARALNLKPAEYVFSAALRRWCEENKNRCYVPEWLLKEWQMTVDPNFSAA